MPKGKSNKGRRGGKKSAKTEHVTEETVTEADLYSSNISASDHELVEGDQSKDECILLEPSDDEVLSFKTEMASENCDGLNNKTDSEVSSVLALDKEKVSLGEEAQDGKCLDTSESISEEKLNIESDHQDDDSIHEDKTIIDKSTTDMLATEHSEAKSLGTVQESIIIAEEGAEQYVDDQKKNDNFQNVVMKANEDHSVLDVIENDCKNTSNEQQIALEIGDLIGANKTETADLLESQNVEEVENSKFEEISEGSIEQAEQDDLIAESLSDVEIIGESFDPKMVQSSKSYPNIKEQIKSLYKKPQSLEAVYITEKSDKVKSSTENKDNDDISDASLSDHADAELSLEEISDDELEPSKKRRKSSGQTPVHAGSDLKGGDNTKPDKENADRADDMFEKGKVDGTSVKAQKHVASDKIGASIPNTNKRIKLDEKLDNEEVHSKGEEISTFSTEVHDDSKNETEWPETKALDVSYNRNVISNRNIPQSSTNWRQHNTKRSLELRDLVTLKRKYDMVDSSCQSEPRLLKGKIIQCNINPIKLTPESDKHEMCADLGLLSKFTNKHPFKIQNKVISDICSVQPSQKKGMYSISMGPLMLSDTYSLTFKDILNGTESFSLVFANHSHGVLKASFANRDSIVSLFTWLNHQESNTHDMVMSVLYTCQEEGHDSVWKATLLHVSEASIQNKDHTVTDDEGNGVRLYLHGVPTSVSTSFIHVLFPDAQNVVTDPETSTGIVTLDYSSPKMAEAVLSSYGLLIINNSQINISLVKSLDDQQNVNFSQEALNESDTSEQKPSQVVQNEVASDVGKEVSSLTIAGAEVLENVFTNMESNVVSEISDKDSSLSLIDKTKETRAEEIDTFVNTENQCAEGTELRNESVENSVLDKTDMQENDSNKPKTQVEETGEDITSGSVQFLAEVETANGKDKFLTLLDDDDDKMDARVQDGASSENKLLTNKDTTPSECEVGMPLQEVDNAEEKKLEKDVENGTCKTSSKVTGEIEAEKEILEDVSDDEVVNHNRHGIVVKDSSKQVISDVGLTFDSMTCLDNEKTKQGVEDRGKISDSQVRESGDAKDDHSESMNPTLVMTDGDLEVMMEVIDVNDGDDNMEKIVYASTWHRSQDRPGDSAFNYSSYANKLDMQTTQKDPYKEHLAGGSRHHYPWSWKELSGHKEMFGKSQKRDSFPPKHRSRSPSPRRDVDLYARRHDYRSYESQHPGRYGDSRRIESYSKQPVTVKSSGYNPHRDTHYSKQRQDYKRPRSPSLSKRSESPENKVVSLHKSHYRRESPKHTVLHDSPSPISISSSSRSLSPVSKSPSMEAGVEKYELAKTVEHFLKLAKDLHHTKKRRSLRTKTSRHSSSRYSPRVSRSPYTKRSRSPQALFSRSSRSPTYTRSSRYKHKRSQSPSSGNDRKRHYGSYSISYRKDDPYNKESGSSRNYEYEKHQRSREYSFDEQSSRSKSWKMQTEQYRGPNNQPWQQSHGGYQTQSCGPVPASNIFSPSFPPPSCPPQQAQTGMYPGNSMAVYQYNSQSQYSCSNIPPNVPPPYTPNIPPPLPPQHSFNQPYQSAYPMYPPRF